MPRKAPFGTRSLSADDGSAERLATGAGAHGVYVKNALAAGEGEGFVAAREDVDRALCWFGPRGNLVVLAAADLAADEARALVDAIAVERRTWRIAMGPAAVVDELRTRIVGKPLVHRDQVYYGGVAADGPRDVAAHEVRPAERADRDRLVQATLMLNQADLNIDPAQVDRRWLRDTIDERTADGTTRLIGPLGSPSCKLDFGSSGPGGLVLEGVFTFPELRGRGLASALVAACLRQAPGFVCLHVGSHNRPARAAYERAGLREVGQCRLLLLG